MPVTSSFSVGKFAGNDRALMTLLVVIAVLARAAAVVLLADFDVQHAWIWEYGDQGFCAVQTGGDLCLMDRTEHAYLSAYVPPLLSYLWWLLFSSLGPNPAALAVYVALNVVCGAVSTVLCFVLGLRCGFGRGAAFLAGLILALYPTFVFVSATYHATNFTVALTLGAMLALIAAARRLTVMRVLGVGILLGLGAMSRSEMLPIGMALVMLLAYWRRASRKQAATILVVGFAGIALIVTPWVARNAVVFDAFIPGANSSGYNLWKSFSRFADGSGNQVEDNPAGALERKRIRESVPLGDRAGFRYESRVQAAFARETRQDLRSAGPTRLAVLTLRKLVLLWVFDWTDEVTRRVTYLAPWAVINGLALFGLVLSIRRRGAGLEPVAISFVIATAALFTGAYAVTCIHARYRMHLEPLVFLLAGVGAERVLGLLSKSLSSRVSLPAWMQPHALERAPAGVSSTETVTAADARAAVPSDSGRVRPD
jgi:4-amino-4-deoxy-L-arabinose transferase-like glycosyltransferase